MSGPIAWMSTAETAEFLGVTLRTVYRFIDDGQLPAYRFGRVIRVKQEDVEAFVESSRIEPGSLEHLHPEPAAKAGTPAAFPTASPTSPAGREKMEPGG